MATQIWKWNNFRGGLSDNPYFGTEGSFQNGSYGVDIETEPNGVKLLSGVTSFTTTGNPTLQFEYDGVHYVFCSDKSIYVDGVVKYAYDSAVAIAMGVIYGVNVMTVSGTPYLYLIGNSAIHKSSLDMSTVTYNFQAIAQHAVKKPSIVYGNDIYFVNGNLFCKYSDAEVLTVEYTANIHNTFTGLTFFQDQFRLYSSYDHGKSGKHFLISVTDLTAPEYIVDWDNLPILGVTNVGGIDYAIAGYSLPLASDLYIVSGTQRKQIKGNLESNTHLRGFGGIISSRFDDVYFGGTYGTNSGVFRYGSTFPGINDTLTQLLTFSGTTYSILNTQAYSYFGVTVGETPTVYKYEHATPPYGACYYADVGEIISLVQDFGNPHIKKSLLQIDIPYDCDNSYTAIPHGGTITLYARKDSSDSWTQLYTGTPDSGIGSIRILNNQLTALNFGDFYQIEFKLKLQPATNGGNNYYTPLVKGVIVIYEDGIQV